MYLDRCIALHHLQVAETTQLEMGVRQPHYLGIQFNGGDGAWYPQFLAQDGHRAARSQSEHKH